MIARQTRGMICNTNDDIAVPVTLFHVIFSLMITLFVPRPSPLGTPSTPPTGYHINNNQQQLVVTSTRKVQEHMHNFSCNATTNQKKF